LLAGTMTPTEVTSIDDNFTARGLRVVPLLL
jgi:hypothetical protein